MPLANRTLEYWILKYLSGESCAKGAGSLLEDLGKHGVTISEAGVGRAMRAMRNAGLLEKVGKQGHRITPSGTERLVKMEEEKELREFLGHVTAHPKKLGRTNLIDRLIVRKAIEREAAYQAALNATEEDIRAIEEIVQTQYENMRKNEDFVDLSSQFHRAVLKAAKVPLLETVYDFIGITSKWQNFFVGTFKVYDTPVNVSHEEVLRAMEARDPERAAKAMEAHLDDVITNARKFASEKKRGPRSRP